MMSFYSIQIRTRSSLILIIQLHQDLKILDDDIDMRAGSLSGTIFVNMWSDLRVLDPWHVNKDLGFLNDVTVPYWLKVSYTWIITVLANVLHIWIDMYSWLMNNTIHMNSDVCTNINHFGETVTIYKMEPAVP